MPRLRPARESEIAAILAESHALWGAGLTVEAYRQMWAELRATAWGRRAFEYLVWAGEDGEVLSSLKLYRPVVRLLGRTARAAVIGAVFTPRTRRRRGYAAAMLRAVLDEARARGDNPALLFTDIGTAYYAALGFRALPGEEAWGKLPRSAVPAPPGWELRAMAPGESDAVRAAHDAWCDGRPLAVLRDRDHWEFLVARASGFFGRLDGSDLSRRYRVALHEGRFAGYLISVEGEGAWSVREVGAVGADREAMAAILRTGAAEARAAGVRKVFGWLPREVAPLLPEWELRYETRQRAVPMILDLEGRADLDVLDSPGAAFISYLDQF